MSDRIFREKNIKSGGRWTPLQFQYLKNFLILHTFHFLLSMADNSKSDIRSDQNLLIPGSAGGSLKRKKKWISNVFEESFWSKFFLIGLREIKRSKASYFLGFLSCFLVVTIASLLLTIINKSPIIFLTMAEMETAEIDLRISTGSWATHNLLNYSLISDLYPELEFSYHSPRIHKPITILGSSTCSSKVDLFDPYWKYISNNTCVQDSYGCFLKFCPKSLAQGGDLILINSEREERMHLGREWISHNHPRLGSGEALISKELAKILKITKGGILFLYFNASFFFEDLWRILILKYTFFWPGHSENPDFVFIPVKVVGIFEGSQGKVSFYNKHSVIMEYGLMTSYLSQHVHPHLPSSSIMALKTANLDHYAQNIIWNLPPPRTLTYINTDTESIRSAVITWSSKILYRTNFNDLEIEVPVLRSLEQTNDLALISELVLKVIIAVLVILSVLLIYALLTIGVRSKIWEMGVLRGMGTSNYKMVYIVLLKSISFTIPALILGLVVGQVISLFVGKLLKQYTYIDSGGEGLSVEAVSLSTLLAILVPLAASFLPIKDILGKSIISSMDKKRSRTKAVEISIERSENQTIQWSYIILGCLSSAFGFVVYSIFPYSLITGKMQILLYILLVLFIGMLLGITTICTNIEVIFERCLVHLFFFWECSVVHTLLMKNLIAHRLRNRQTAMMYSLSIGFIIFLSVVYKMQVMDFIFDQKRLSGSYLQISAYGIFVGTTRQSSIEILPDIEKFAIKNPYIEDYAMSSLPLNQLYFGDGVTSVTTRSKLQKLDVSIVAISKNYLNVTFPDLYVNPDGRSGNEVLDELYKYDETNKMILSSSFKKHLALRDEDPEFLIKISTSSALGTMSNSRLWKAQSTAFLDNCPGFSMSRFELNQQDALVSFPTFVNLSNGTIYAPGEVPIKHVLFKLVDGITDSQFKSVKDGLEALIAASQQKNLLVYNFKQNIVRAEIGVKITTGLFCIGVILAMVICFFSLLSSVYVNIYEQHKEIAILRALGIATKSFYRIYIYEAFILIFSSGILGGAIGVFIGWTMFLQNFFFTMMPIPIILPWELFSLVFGLSIICSVIASWKPIRNLMKQNIVKLLLE